MRRDSSRAIATDSEGHELRVNDNVKEIDGEVSSYQHNPFLFVHVLVILGSQRSRSTYAPIFLCFLAQSRHR